MSWVQELTSVGTIASIIGALVALISAIKSASAKKDAESARDEAKNAMAGHHRAEALSEARQKGTAAIEALAPFYSAGTDGPKGATVDDALEKLAAFTVSLASASSQFPSGQHSIEKADQIIGSIDKYVDQYRETSDPTSSRKKLKLIYTETREALKLLAGELYESRQGV
tara:strand:- start:2914 stop:3423 length:510 start_codon:yes stop_codon:yes gene_type:complete